jgi:hypothetical protein
MNIAILLVLFNLATHVSGDNICARQLCPALGLDFNNEDAANEASVLPTSK